MQAERFEIQTHWTVNVHIVHLENIDAFHLLFQTAPDDVQHWWLMDSLSIKNKKVAASAVNF